MDKKNYPWKRPENVPYPSVWKRFKGRREIDGVIPNFWIQDIPEEDMENAIDFMMSGFPRDEPLNRSSGLASKSESLIFLRNLLKEVLQCKIALICYTDNPDPNGKPIIAGMNATFPKTKWDPEDPITDETILKIIDTMETVVKLVDAFEVLKTDVLLGAMGLYVSPNFRGQNLGLELLNAREDLCKAVGIKASVTVFTALVSQILAERAGFKVLSEMSLADLQKHDSRFIYPGIEEHTTVIKHMYKEF
ncbi:hypothetical protein FQR65_LT03758 [Abscondita terminalis]|nr:hypothetical protein FQR65_LT03758 [Abscondita terminalis]